MQWNSINCYTLQEFGLGDTGTTYAIRMTVLWSVDCPDLQYFLNLYLIMHNFLRKVAEYNIWVLIISTDYF
jgi:hypothetical protein